MGYTHYWDIEKFTRKDQSGYKKALPIIKDILRKHTDIICMEYDQPGTPAIANETEIRFNGKDDEGHETFVFLVSDRASQGNHTHSSSNFCKTARKLYDKVVCMVLLTLKAYMPNMQLSSDGFCGMLSDCRDNPVLDENWPAAIEELKDYGIAYETRLTKERDPYCDMEPVLISVNNIGEFTIAEADMQITDDNTECVCCAVCGHTAPQLLSHMHAAHDLTLEQYTAKYPAAQPFSAGFMKFASESNLRVEDDQVVLDRDVLGINITRSVRRRTHVPHVDNGYYFDEKAPYVLRSLLDNDRILLVGHTGCGKSSLIEQLAARVNHPVRRFNLHGEVAVADFLGQWVINEGKMTYRYGVLPTAMKEGQILVLEELDAADPSVLFILQGVLEDNGRLIIPDNGGEIIEAHKDFRLCATANTLGLGDDSGLYAGTRVLNASHLDRWSAVFEMSYLPPEKETEVLLAKVDSLTDDKAKRLVNLANAVRKAADEEQICCTFSTRRLLALANKSITYNSIQNALEVTVLSKLSPTDRSVVVEIANRIL